MRERYNLKQRNVLVIARDIKGLEGEGPGSDGGAL